MTYFIDESEYLEHYGVKGMKWGVRHEREKVGRKKKKLFKNEKEYRYMQYAYGPGDKHGTDLVEFFQENVDKEFVKKGIKKIDKYTDEIAPGENIKRVCPKNEKLSDNEKYFSILDHDNRLYRDAAGELDASEGQTDIVQRTYKNEKPLRIANERAVNKYIMDKYGNSTLSEVAKKEIGFKAVKKYLWMYGNEKISDIYDYDAAAKADYLRAKTKKVLSERLAIIGYTRKQNLANAFGRSVYGNKSELNKYFKSKGYDGYVDIEDRSYYTIYPVVLMDPQSKLKPVKEESLNN